MVGAAGAGRDRGLGRAAARPRGRRRPVGRRRVHPPWLRPSEWVQVGQPWTATCFTIPASRVRPGPRADLGPADGASWSGPTPAGSTRTSRSGRARSRSASTGAPSPTGPTSGWTSRPLSIGWSVSGSTTAAGTASVREGSVRSSFATTINVLEGLAQFERATGGTTASREARASGEEFLLERQLFRRLSTGETGRRRLPRAAPPEPLEVRRAACARPLPRCRLAHRNAARRQARRGGRAPPLTPLPRRHVAAGPDPPGRTWFDVDGGVGRPSPWVTLKAARVLAWVDAG